MKLALHIAVFGPDITFVELRKNLLELGVRNIELPVQLWISKDAEEQKIIKEFNVINLSSLLHKNTILPKSIFMNENEFNQQLNALQVKLDAASKLGCKSFALCIDPYTALTKNEARDLLIFRVKTLSKLLESNDLELHLEYVNHTACRHYFNESMNLFCSSFEYACELIHQINLPNVKLLLDFLHYSASEVKIELARIKNIIGFVHICDYMARETIVLDSDRVLPFEGDSPIFNFLEELKSINYSGYVAVEVFPHQSYKPTNLQIAKSLSRLKNKCLNG